MESYRMSLLTYKKKKEYFEILVKRDDYKCFYCEGEFSENHPAEYDHLNNNPKDSRPENLVFSHHECNNRKKFNTDYQIMANEKLERNEKAVLTCERTLVDTGTTKELTSQQEISKCNMNITKQFLQEHTINNEELLLKDAVNAIVNLCQDNNETGSQSAIYRYIDSLSNPYNGKYTVSTNAQGKDIIRRRTEN